MTTVTVGSDTQDPMWIGMDRLRWYPEQAMDLWDDNGMN